MKRSTKIILPIAAIILIAIGAYFAHYYIKYVSYNEHKDLMKSEYDTEYEKGSKYKPLTNDNKVPGMDLIAQNDGYNLYINKTNASIAVYDKANEEITLSNPVNPEKDIIAQSAYEQARLQSQMIISYYNTQRELTSWYSYTDAVEKGQFTIENIENGVRVIYQYGDLESKTGIIPLYISEERFEEVTSKMSKESAKAVKSLYSKSTSVSGFMEIPQDSIVGHASTKRKLTGYFEEAGYTAEDCEKDVLESGVEGVLPITFVIPLEYRLVDDGLQVNIPTSEIEETGGGKLAQIQLLNLMGAVKAPDSKLIVKKANPDLEAESEGGAAEGAAGDTPAEGTEPAAGNAAEGEAKPAAEPAAGNAAEDEAKPTAKPAADNAAEGEAKPTAEPAADNAAEDEAKPTAEPAAGNTPKDGAEPAKEAGEDDTLTLDDLKDTVDTSVIAEDEISGYFVLPNGSGSLMNFNNGKTDAEIYNEFIYGIDPLSADYTVTQNTESCRLPLFGIQKLAGNVQHKDYGILAVIENGESFAQISASTSSKVNSYNYAYPTFVLRGDEKLAMFGSSGNNSDMSVVEDELYKVNIQVHYSFLNEEYSGYSGMANYYREKLMEKEELVKKEDSGDIPFYMDVIGGVKATETFMGVKYMKTVAMTSFEQAGQIADDFYKQNINNISMNYQGWFNGGYYHDVADSIGDLGVLGGKNDLKELAQKIESNGGRLYGDVAFQQVSYISDNYRPTAETARYYGGGVLASFGQVNPVTLKQTAALGYRETLYNLLSPKFLPRYVNAFCEDVKDVGVTGISLRDLSAQLHSDKKRTGFINREQAKNIVSAELAKVKDTGMPVLGNNANAYALKYVDELVNVSTNTNGYLMVDDEIPFYELVIHGCIDYAGNAVNLSNSSDILALELKMIEYGQAPHFTFSYENSNEIKYTGLNRMYSTDYQDWEQDAIEIYQYVNEALSKVSGALIVKHEMIDGVAKVTYDNGVIIYVNRTNQGVTVDGITIEARSYKLGGNAQ